MSRSSMQIIGGVVLAIAIAGGGFIAGMTTAQARGVGASPSASPAGGRGAGGLGAGGAGAANANRGVTGQIIAVNADSITIMTRTAGPAGASPTAGSSIVLVGQGTRVVKATETDIKLGDLKAGDQVTVVGAPDTATGTISAQAVVLGGANVLQQLFGGAGGTGGAAGGRGGASPSPSPR